MFIFVSAKGMRRPFILLYSVDILTNQRTILFRDVQQLLQMVTEGDGDGENEKTHCNID